MLGVAVNAAKRHIISRARPGFRNCRSMSDKIIYTITDEAPMLATYSLLPVIQRFAKPAGIKVETSDISVAARIITHFNDRLKPDQQVPDNLADLGKLCKTPGANIIKLPNVSASIPQLNEAIAELQSKGYNIPNYPQVPKTPEEEEIKARYAKVLGSAVNPVLREGNSDRRAAPPVKAYAQKNPHKLGKWDPSSKTHVAHMSGGDFYANEKSAIMDKACTVKIEFVAKDGTTKVMKEKTALLAGEVIDASFMSKKALRAFLKDQIVDAKSKDILFSLHLKATMMKISDPIMFGHCVTVFFEELFDKHAATFAKLGVNPNNGFGDVIEKIESLPEGERKAIEADIQAIYAKQPRLAMVNSAKGITNLHVPSDVIVDASMPVVVRDSGKMWNKDDKLEDCKATIPDRSYAPMYQAVIDYVKTNGQFDVSTMGHVSNVGLMAQKAEEYGSHDKTFEIAAAGTMGVTDDSGKEIFSHSVEEGDIWRMCQTKDEPVKDWVKLAVSRARASGSPAVFWLDPNRPHDMNIKSKVDAYLKDHDTAGLEIKVMSPVDAVNFSMTRATAGNDTISCTGNVLRDYLTDLFPIIELGTSAKMLSIVPLLAGGSLFETGAGGSAPKHVEQFQEEGHLRWDSLGEYLAMACALDDMGVKTKNERAMNLGKCLMQAVGKLLDNANGPSRKVKQIDNRGSNFYVALYWAEAMGEKDAAFKELAEKLSSNKEQILKELIDCQGTPQDFGGYYWPDHVKAAKAMRSSPTMNSILDA